MLAQAQGDQGLLGRIQAALRVQHRQVVVDTGLKARIRQIECFLRGIDHAGLRAQAVGPLCPVGQRIGRLLEGRLHGFFVLRSGNALVGLGHLYAGTQATPIKNGQLDLRHEAPGAIATAKQAVQFPAARTDAARERDAGEQGRPRGTDVGVHGAQVVLCRLHIRALQQHAGVQVQRHRHKCHVVGIVRGHGLRRGQQGLGHRAADQQLQGIATACGLRGIGGHIAAGRFNG